MKPFRKSTTSTKELGTVTVNAFVVKFIQIPWPVEMDNMAWESGSLAEAVGMPGGAAEDVPVCPILGTANVMAIKKRNYKWEGEIC